MTAVLSGRTSALRRRKESGVSSVSIIGVSAAATAMSAGQRRSWHRRQDVVGAATTLLPGRCRGPVSVLRWADDPDSGWTARFPAAGRSGSLPRVTDSRLAACVDRTERCVGDIVDAVVAAILNEIGIYRDGVVVPRGDLRRSVSDNVR